MGSRWRKADRKLCLSFIWLLSNGIQGMKRSQNCAPGRMAWHEIWMDWFVCHCCLLVSIYQLSVYPCGMELSEQLIYLVVCLLVKVSAIPTGYPSNLSTTTTHHCDQRALHAAHTGILLAIQVIWTASTLQNCWLAASSQQLEATSIVGDQLPPPGLALPWSFWATFLFTSYLYKIWESVIFLDHWGLWHSCIIRVLWLQKVQYGLSSVFIPSIQE